MAFTDAETVQIRTYLGYSDNQFASPLSRALTVITPEGETRVRGYLASLTSLEATMEASWGCLKIARADKVSFQSIEAMREWRRAGTRLINNIAAVLGISVRKPYFSTQASDSPYLGLY